MMHSTIAECVPITIPKAYTGNSNRLIFSTLLFTLLSLISVSMLAQTAFVRSDQNLWDGSDAQYHIDALDQIFGAGSWSDLRVETLDVTDLLADHTFIYIDGGDAGADEVEAFLDANLPAIEAWVTAGGHLLLNAAPNEGDGMSFGFGGVELVAINYFDFGEATDPAHPIFDGLATSYEGDYFGHALICPAGMTAIMNETGIPANVCLGEMSFGSGHAVFGGLTLPFFGHSLWTDDSYDLLVQLLEYASEGAAVSIPGCTDSLACNFDSTANEDDGSCTFPGCEDVAACNFDSLAGCDDGSCEYAMWYIPNVLGAGPIMLVCEQPDGYFLADQDCAQEVVDNDPFCVDTNWDSICENAYLACAPIPGCTDSTACNYNPSASEDDGSCEASNGTIEMFDSFGDGWNGGEYFITDCATGELLQSGTLASGDFGIDPLCLDDGCFSIEVTGGTFASEIAWEIFDADGNSLLTGNAPSVGGLFGLGSPDCGGCTDPDALNYDSTAVCDNGSCEYDEPENNDECADAIAIECGQTISGSTSDATFDGVDFCGTSNTAAGVWYTLTPDADATITLSTCNQANYDTKISVFTGDCDNLECVTGQDDAAGCAGFSSELPFDATGGTEYLILIHGFGTATGDFDLTITCEEDECDPAVEITCPADVSLECGSSIDPLDTGIPTFTTSECTGDVELTYNDDQVSNDNCPLIIARTWVATADGASDLCTQLITISDTEAPVITSFPEDLHVECLGLDPEDYFDLMEEVEEPTAEDCSDFEMDVDVEFVLTGECPLVAQCFKYVWFVDECGNGVEQTFTLNIYDTTGPDIEDFEDPVLVSCLEEVPAPEDLSSTDLCSGSEFDVEYFETNNGELTDTCNLSVAFGPGDDWALWLPVLHAEGKVSSANFIFDENGGQFDAFNDGTANLTGTVVNDANPAESFVLDLWFENKADWATWSSMGRSYKDDLGCAQPDLYEDWTYYEMANVVSTATGQGDLAGDILHFYHMPSNYYFGFQIGMGANNKNCDYGMSGWFTYTGMVDGMIVEGNGDVNVDAECGPVNEFDCPHDTEFTYFYFAQDDCGNVTIDTQTIIVNDEIGPEFVVFLEDLTVDCDDYPVEIAEVEAIDNCEGDVEVEGPTDMMFPGDCPNEWTVERTWIAVDICGNITEMTQTINVVDNDAPEFDGLPADETVECDAIPEPADVTVSDNCSDVENIDFWMTEDIEDGECTGQYWIIRTWYAVDECDNENSYTQTISVIDTTAPVFDAYEANIEMPCDDVSTTVDLTATDNCGDVEVSFEDELTDEGCAGSIIRTYTATDDCGNSATAVQNITLLDGTAPWFTSFPADDTVECDNVPEVASELSYDDNCTEVTINFDGEEILPGNCDGNYTIIRTWTITDNCDNSTTASQTITVQDTTPPEFTYIPQGGEYSCDEELPTENAEAEDNCSGATVTYEDVMTPGDCENSYSIERTFTAVDGCGNSASESIEFFIYDNEAPEFTSVQADMTLECDEEVPAPEATAEDNCDADVTIEVSEEIIEGDCPQEYTLIRTYTATDNCGNSSEATQTINVIDSTAPEFVDYEFYTYVECEDIDDYTLEATDNCGEVTVEIIEEILNSGGCMGVLWRIYVATDECGNSTEVEQYIVITDTTAPELLDVPADTTMECSDMQMGEDGNYFTSEPVSAEDNCALDVEILYSEEMVDDGDDCVDSYIIIRTWIAIDYCENESMAQQTVTVVDTTDPEFTAFPEDFTIECSDEMPEPEVPTAEDNCDDDVELELTEETQDGDCEGEYTLFRIWRAFDNCGNEALMVQEISVVDTTAPEFTSVPEDATYECDEDILDEEATAEDNCSDATITVEDGEIIPGDCAANYSFVRTFTATDDCGNSSTATQNITVVDTTAPVFDAYEVNIEMPCDQIDDSILVTATDNCSEFVITFEDSPVSGGCAGVIIRDYTATDACGNESYAQQIINLTDIVEPEWTAFPLDGTVECDEVPGPSQLLDAEDNCDDDVEILYLGEEIIEGDCDGNYTIIRTWVAIDDCGNENERSQTITVEDTTAPEFTEVPEGGEYSCDEELPTDNAEAEDNCSGASVTYADEMIDGDCPQSYTVVRTFTAVDGCGNEATTSIEFYIYDDEAPVFTYVPADYVAECDDELVLEDAEATDNCGEVFITEFPVIEPIDGCPQAYTMVRAFIAIDECGNESAAWQVITVLDTTAPIFDDYEVNIEMPCDEIDDSITVSATDNCGEVTITFEDDVVSGGCAGVIIRDYTAVDECGNEAYAQQIINLTDEVAPEFDSFPADETVECDDVPAVAECLDGDAQEGFEGDFDPAEWTIETGGGDGSVEFTDGTTLTIIGNDNDFGGVNTQATVTCPADASYSFSWDYTSFDVDGPFFDPAYYVNGIEYPLSDDGGSSSQSGMLTLDCNAGDVIGFGVNSTDGALGAAVLVIDGFIWGAVEDCVTATDNCDDDVEIIYQGEVITPGDCDGSYTIERTWLAIDNCLNETLQTQTITVIDTTAPEFTYVPQGGEYSCDEDLPTENAEAEDNCSDADVDYTDEMIDGDCPQSYTIIRTFTATDDCGNSASVSIEFFIYDNEAPVFTYVPADYIAECDEELVLEDAEATDNCGEVFITEFPVIEPIDGCPQAYTMVRAFIAIDECGNESAAWQVITVLDTTAPIFDDYEAQIEMPCDDIDDNILVSATDNCGEVTITYEDSPVSGGCAGVIIRDYTAVDECGNESYAQQIINLTDEVAPELAGVPADLDVECGDDIPQPADVTATDNCDDDLEVILTEDIVDLDCLYAIHRTWTVTDNCGNSDSATQIITIIDTTAPEFEGGDITIDAECDEDITVETPEAFDICDEDVDVSAEMESTPGSCANEWTEVHTFTATDDCGNSAQLTVTVNYSDTTAPEFTFVPADYTAECDDVLEMLDATATDNCGEVFITELPVIEPLNCDDAYIMTRIFIATDECGNQSSAAQVITVLDTTPPTFDQEVEDMTVECYGDAVIPELTASDNCSDATVTMDSFEDVDECGNGVILVSYIAEDECGNISETGLTITIEDTTAPEFEGELPADLVIDCEADAPEAPELTATDNCDDDVEVTYTEELVGDLPAEGSDSDCLIFTGESPYYNPDWSLWLQQFPNGDEFYATDEAYFVEYPDGTAHLFGHVTSTSNPDAGWDIDVWFMDGMDWDSWSTQAFPTSYKDDFNLAGDNYLDWTYYIVNGDSATLTGTGDYAGSLLTLAHAPSNMFYGYQVGIAANNTNSNYGNGGWFYYDGILVEDGVETEVSGAGDFAFDADCCPRYEIVRTWVAVDCSGNETSWTQTISFDDLDEGGEPEGGVLPQVDIDSKWDTETEALTHKVYPNPVIGNATFKFTPVNDGWTTLEIFNLSGSKTSLVFNQQVEAGVEYKVPFSSGEMAGGVYLYQIVNGDTVVTDKLIISK